ncbi:MAG: imidazoleglycerol-phosphate dehydratase HisB [Clostridia bacterium]|nr:imidazoleglycerol-phosphate dehydratase HisB [Clostridia bacterium]MDY2933150.1 imidazoleglycerol-phosphate dehydratase HisB [Anaerovoracaceae bacterium]
MRSAVLERKTSETQIKLSLDIDGSGTSEISSGIGFLDHMLTLFAKHSGFNLEVSCTGDTYVDDHHSCEDIGIVLGSALREALGDKRGISRYGDIILPMDEALILCACDVSGRSCLVFDADFPTEKIGSFDTELVQEFFEAFTRSSGITLHIRKLSGANSHHIAEGIFKAFARCLAKACGIDEKRKDEIPSTKGVI